MPKPPDYGIIYNWDGAPHGYSGFPQSMDQFLEKVYAPMEDTQVGAHFWCVGEHQARWKSDVLELVGDVHERQYESPYSYTFNENIRAMLERDEDPQQELISQGHDLGMHVYASVRMNDNHFNGAQIKDLPTMRSTELMRLRVEHPEWLLGDKTTEWFALSWNFEVPEVREHRYKHIEELCHRYDWDGVELDWQRHAFHFPDDQGYRLKYLLTDLMRAARSMTNALAQERGKPFYVAARVSATLARIHRRTSLGTALEEASGCSSESGIMVLEQKPARKQGAPNRCCHRTNPTVSASSLTTIAWWPMVACSCRPPYPGTWACGNSSTITLTSAERRDGRTLGTRC